MLSGTDNRIARLGRNHPELRRDQILDEGIRIIGQLGYHGFTVQELARRCGLSNAGLLYHFSSKDLLLVAVVEEMEQREIQAMAPLIERVETERKRNGSPVTAVLDLLHVMVERGSTRPELARLYTVLQSESLDDAHPAHDSFRKRESAVLGLFTKLVAPYVADPDSTARQLLALLDGLRLQWLRSDQEFDVVATWIRGVGSLVPALSRTHEEQHTPPVATESLSPCQAHGETSRTTPAQRIRR